MKLAWKSPETPPDVYDSLYLALAMAEKREWSPPTKFYDALAGTPASGISSDRDVT